MAQLNIILIVIAIVIGPLFVLIYRNTTDEKMKDVRGETPKVGPRKFTQ